MRTDAGRPGAEAARKARETWERERNRMENRMKNGGESNRERMRETRRGASRGADSGGRVRQMALCAMFAALIAVGAFIRIPVPVCPFTLQVLFVLLAGMMLGSRGGAVSATLYLAIGLVGVPIFTKGGGLWYVAEPTFGYIVGFVVGAFWTGWIAQRRRYPSFLRLTAAGLAGMAAIYAIGLVYYYVAANWFVAQPIGVWALILHCFLMTLPGDLVSCVACAALSRRLIPLVQKG